MKSLYNRYIINNLGYIYRTDTATWEIFNRSPYKFLRRDNLQNYLIETIFDGKTVKDLFKTLVFNKKNGHIDFILHYVSACDAYQGHYVLLKALD